MIKKVMQPPVCAPKVEGFMLKPEFWIEKIEDAKKLILNDQEIIEFNKKSFRKMNTFKLSGSRLFLILNFLL